ncbi:hypothetical protein [Aeoliella mucimassa]|uniref:Uncharacterized protein n=1 Tax=Aeoliella mucimassa TaxID=2527972 RepID=A0A518AHW5_9BACT|nr:hypothetical protein [Aeoliella mucimassa]QDU54326.1 hypothetical protein Pan181_05070 [Aeoliella mucimassa]
MPTAHDIRGTVFKHGSAVLLARIVGPEGTAVTTSDLASVRYSVYQVDPVDPDALTAVEGHAEVSLTVADVFYDTLQTGGPWSVDETGYNFRHDLPVDSDEAFPIAGADYQVRYEVIPTSGQKLVFRFAVRCI